jgi:hypothetical protein
LASARVGAVFKLSAKVDDSRWAWLYQLAVPAKILSMPEKWRVTVTVGNPEPSVGELIARSLPADTLPAYIGYGGDLRLSIVMVTVEAETEDQAAKQATAMVKQACLGADWNFEPEAGTIASASNDSE